MCGIFGISSTKPISNPLVKGLLKLEYRGYDSAGISGHGIKNQLVTIKATGPIKNLKSKLYKLQGITTGISHTRWATHGQPTLKNTHPHLSGAICTVHNGIIENYIDLKLYLKKKSFIFKSDTDSEVICHLINYYFSKSANMQSAIISTANSLEGSYALAAINTQTPHTIYSACKGSPIILGKDVSSNYISSDMTPIVDHTKNYIPMDDNEFSEISSSDIKIFNKNKRVLSKPTKVSKINKNQASLMGHKHFMHKEIYEQKAIIEDMINRYVGKDKILPNIFGHSTDKLLENIKHIHFIACGTSYHASLVAKDWIEQFTTVTCTAEVASEYKYKKINVLPHTLFVSISQSGETADTISSLKKALKLSLIHISEPTRP